MPRFRRVIFGDVMSYNSLTTVTFSSARTWTPFHHPRYSDPHCTHFFQVASANDRALDAITKACDCYKEMRSLYQAGKMLEQAVLLCRDMNQFDKIGGFAERGALLYRQGKAKY